MRINNYKRERRNQQASDDHSIRTLLGCSQQELADFLAIPRSTLAMEEIRERILPTNAWSLLHRILICVQRPDVEGNLRDIEVAEEKKRIEKWRQEMISTYSFQLRKYQRLLVKKETAYARCLASLAALSKITFDSEGTRRQYEEHMLGSWIYTQKIKLNKEGMIQILQLKMKIAGIESELTALRSM